MSAQGGQDAKFFQRGKIQVRNSFRSRGDNGDHVPQEFRAELEAAESKDKKFTKRKTVLKKIVANITMGNDSEQALYCRQRDATLMGCRSVCSVPFVH